MAHRPSLADNDRFDAEETALMSAAATSPVMLSMLGIGGRRMGVSGYGCQVANMLPLGAPVGGRPCRQGLGGKDEQPMSKLNRAELDRRGVGAGCQQGPAGSGPRMPYYMPPVHCPDSPYGVGGRYEQQQAYQACLKRCYWSNLGHDYATKKVCYDKCKAIQHGIQSAPGAQPQPSGLPGHPGSMAWKPGRPAKHGTWVAQVAQARAGGSLPVRAPQRVARGRLKDALCALLPGMKMCAGPAEPPCGPGDEPCGLKPGGDIRCCPKMTRGPALAWGGTMPKKPNGGAYLPGVPVPRSADLPGVPVPLPHPRPTPPRGLTLRGTGRRGGIGKSYAKRLFGDGLSVDVQNHGNGHYSATVNAQGGSYAHKVFGNHFQADVARSGNGYRAAVRTHAPQGVQGVGATKPLSGTHAAAIARGVGGCGSGQRGRSAPFRNPTGVQYGVGGAVGAQPGMAYGVHDDAQQAGVFGPIVGRWPGMAVVGR